METLHTLTRLARVEALKFWRKPVAWVVLGLMFAGPVTGEALVASLSRRDALFPRAAQLLFSADMLLFIALATVVLSVLALGVDYELGTVRVFLSRGVARYQMILSKTIATVSAALANGLVYITASILSTAIAHAVLEGAPFFEAAGQDILWRALGAVGVIGLVNFALSGIVLLALVLGRSAWIGMLAGLGYFFIDFFIGAIGSGIVLGAEVFRYTISYYAISIMEKLFPSDPRLSLPRAWVAQGTASPGQAVMVLLLYGAALTLLSILIFRQQDLLAKN